MTNPQIGETVKYLRTEGLFQIKKVTKDFVILNAQDGSTQVMAGKESFEFLFEKIPPAHSPSKVLDRT